MLRLPDGESVIQNEVLGAYLVLYDCLNDDDEEIREKAAELVFYIVENSKPSFAEVPLAAAETLISWLSSHASSSELCKHAIARLTGASPDIFEEAILDKSNELGGQSLIFCSPIKILAESIAEDHALFVEEKQNLYISQVREAERWSNVAFSMDSTKTISNRFDGFLDWTTSSLELLIGTAEKRSDGPLGWTSIPEVFVFGIRVIHSAEVLFNWLEIGSVTSKELEVCKSLLLRLMQKCQAGKAHELWGVKISGIFGMKTQESF